MARVLRKILTGVPSGSTKGDDDSNHEFSFSFAAEYSGPLLNFEIPRAVPVDVTQIPIAAKISSSSMLNNVSLPIIQPILKFKSSDRKPPKLPELGGNVISSSSDVTSGSYRVSNELSALDHANRGTMEATDGDGCRFSVDIGDSSHGVPERSQGLRVGGNSVEDTGRDFEGYMNPSNCELGESDESSHSLSSEIFSGKEDNCIEDPSHVRRQSVTFVDPESSSVSEEESEISGDESEITPRQMAVRPGPKGTCYKCLKGNRFTDKEACIVCGAKYCYKCLIRAMGSMPEGRKCVTCIGYKIDEMKRKNLGRSSHLLKQLLPKLEVNQIMRSERLCEVNQLPPELVYVNGERLSKPALVLLQTCQHPPKKLEPGYYWYDKTSGFWGKDGQKPRQIITPELPIGGRIRRDASNGNTNIFINNREITKVELFMLQCIGVKFETLNSYWLSADGSYQEEGMNNVKGRIWETKKAKLICAALSLPTPPGPASPNSDENNSVAAQIPPQKTLHKLLLVGGAKSGTSTIFKQAKIVYHIPFSEEERQNIKCMIQSNLYGYLGILLEGREQFEEECLMKKKRHVIDPSSSSDNAGQMNNETIYSISSKLKGFSDWLLKVMVSGNLEAIFPASTREYAPLVEELWNDTAFQATYSRRSELELLPRGATYFLERAVEISKKEYEPSDMDILYAEGMTSSKGLSSMEFLFPGPAQDNSDNNEHDPSIRYQLIRAHPRVLGGNCKWLEMFEDVDMVLFCVSLIDYDEFDIDSNGVCINKMMASKQLFENMVTNLVFEKKKFLLILNKFDLLEEKIQQVPLTRCEWFHDFKPVIGHDSNTFSSSIVRCTNPSLAHRAFQYIATKFKRLFTSLTDKKLFASLVTALEPDNVDEALRYAREVLKWEYEEPFELSSSSIEASSTS